MARGPVLVDTTHWIAFFAGDDAAARAAVALLLAGGSIKTCSIVVAEVLRGFSVIAEASFAMGVLRRCESLPIGRETGERAGLLGSHSAVANAAIPTTDLLIASAAIEARIPVLTSDPHFRKIPGCIVMSSSDVHIRRR